MMPYAHMRWLCSLLLVGMLTMGNSGSDSSEGGRPSEARRGQGSFQSLDDILQYISDDWDNLKRSLVDCKTYEDIKTSGERALYLPTDAANTASLDEMQKRCDVRVVRLPAKITENDAGKIQPHGLLYLENPYVVPGGQFNEMYGWDSYFIVRGLLRDNRRDLAKGMVENFFYEIEHYGGVLNANRTYYLGRSQPPFLSSMILAVYEADKAAGEANLRWLERAYQFAVRDYDQWNREPHLAGDTGLSRYFDEGDGPVPEILGDPGDYYRGVARFFLTHEGKGSPHLVRASSLAGPAAAVWVCDPESSPEKDAECPPADRLGLSDDFYKGDRAMRESGFDVSFRFGPYGAETHHFAPVCLNSLLYKTEKDLEQMSVALGRKDEARRWAAKAAERRERMQKYFWDERQGLFFDYNFETHRRSSYEYATTFYPLWAGFASKEQARAVAANLRLFEQPGGLAMSRYESQAQWDYPYGWAPIHLLAIEGLRRYGYGRDADRITEKFLSMVLDNFRTDHTLREKYNVVTRSSATHIVAGYTQNVTGFGWTNGVFLELLHQSPPELVARLRKD
jgi:alpha,alpha-trehalase